MAEPDTFRYWVPTEIIFGIGVIASLAGHCARHGKRALVITGRGSARASGTLDKVLSQLPGAALFEGVEENPGTAVCDTVAQLCREKGCDHVVALGGGSPIDVAKAVAALATNDVPCSELFGSDKYSNPPLPIVAIPTTAGAGSEVSPYSVLTNEAENIKRTISGRELFPATAILDPELTLSLPRHVTVNTGLDALSQALEGSVSHKSTPMGDVLALEACKLIRKWLPRAAEDGANVEARSKLLYAAMLAGCVIAQSGTTLVHGMGYYYTAQFDIAHGLANALLLTPIFEYNAYQCPETVATLAAALGHPCANTPADASAAISTALHSILSDVGVSPAARDANVQADRLSWCADDIFKDRSRFKNQVGEPSLAAVQGFFQRSYQGLSGDISY